MCVCVCVCFVLFFLTDSFFATPCIMGIFGLISWVNPSRASYIHTYMCRYMTYAVNSDAYICSAQSKNRNISGIVLRKEGILTLLRKKEICTLRKTFRNCLCAKSESGQNESTKM